MTGKSRESLAQMDCDAEHKATAQTTNRTQEELWAHGLVSESKAGSRSKRGTPTWLLLHLQSQGHTPSHERP